MLIIFVLLISGCAQEEYKIIERESSIPDDVVKITPENDLSPPILHSELFENPVQFSDINTAGAEDSPFFSPERNEFYFFFTPDVRVPVEKQLLDGVTGIYVSRKVNGAWEKAERVWLQDPGKLSLDGCAFVEGNTI